MFSVNSAISNNNFEFNTFEFSNHHYTDNRAGAPRYYLAHMLDGKAKIVSEGRTIHISEGDVFFIPKGLPYQSYWFGKEINFLSFGFSSLNISDRLNFNLQKIDCDEKLRQKLLSIPTPGKNIDCKTLSLFYAAVSEILPNMKLGTESNDEVFVDRIKSCIEKNPFSSMREISKLCKISEPYLYMLFKKVTHSTPNDYRQKVLCDMSVELLLTTDKKVEEISELLSFSSSSYFRKVLKKHTGKTPREIKKGRIF